MSREFGAVLKVYRRERDSNPRYVAVYTLSRRAPSATRPPLQVVKNSSYQEIKQSLVLAHRELLIEFDALLTTLDYI